MSESAGYLINVDCVPGKLTLQIDINKEAHFFLSVDGSIYKREKKKKELRVQSTGKKSIKN